MCARAEHCKHTFAPLWLMLKLIHSLLMVISYTFSNLCYLSEYNKKVSQWLTFCCGHRAEVTLNYIFKIQFTDNLVVHMN